MKKTKRFLGSAFNDSRGFTLVEMLIAMAVTLLMMVALGRMFQSVGRGMQDTRANVEMSAHLRTVAFRLNDELARATARMTPPLHSREGAGYLVYYDGPVSDATTLLLTGASPRPEDELVDYRATSKWGDYDDYLAFTAVADTDNYFTGKVPYFIMSSRYPGRFPVGSQPPNSPVTIRSKYAEIIYWMQPVRDGTGAIVDVDGDLIPDRMNLHRRVLLIRPDLNLPATGRLASPGTLPTSSPTPTNFPMVVRRYDPSTIPATGAPQYHYHDPYPANYWQLAEVYQDCDLSVRRSLSPDPGFEGIPQPRTANANLAGDPRTVVANSLEDLTRPHNRFAHVRIPGGVDALSGFGSAGLFSSMPVLDLAGPNAYLTAAQAVLVSNGTPVREVEATSGVLNSRYALRGERVGEDIVLSNVTAFDVRIFDPDAPVVIHAGADGAPGSFGSTVAEYGTLGSDDVVLTPGDPGFYDAIRGTSPAVNATFDASNPWTFLVGSSGAFVDLDYVYKAGGTVQAPRNLSARLTTNLVAFCNTPFSGFDALGTAGTLRAPQTLLKSGRFIPAGGNDPTFYQPIYDTYAADYEMDGFNQAPAAGNVGGNSYPNSRGATLWWVPPHPGTNANPAAIDEGNDGLDQGPSVGVDDFDEQETSAPFRAPLPALQVTIRIEDAATRQVRELAVTQEFTE